MNENLINKELKQAENQIMADMFMTEIKKKQFINELKSGLGDEIKNNKNKLILNKKPWYKKFFLFFKKIFNAF